MKLLAARFFRATAYCDIVHEIVRYERGDRAIANKRSKREYQIV